MAQTKLRKEQLADLKHFQVKLLDSITDMSVTSTLSGDFNISKNPVIVLNVGAYVDVVGTTGLATIDIKEAGVSILSTKITIDSVEKSSATAATFPVISDTSIAGSAVVTFDITGIHTTPAKGLTVWIDYLENI